MPEFETGPKRISEAVLNRLEADLGQRIFTLPGLRFNHYGLVEVKYRPRDSIYSQSGHLWSGGLLSYETPSNYYVTTLSSLPGLVVMDSRSGNIDEVIKPEDIRFVKKLLGEDWPAQRKRVANTGYLLAREEFKTFAKDLRRITRGKKPVEQSIVVLTQVNSSLKGKFFTEIRFTDFFNGLRTIDAIVLDQNQRPVQMIPRLVGQPLFTPDPFPLEPSTTAERVQAFLDLVRRGPNLP